MNIDSAGKIAVVTGAVSGIRKRYNYGPEV